MVWFRQPILTQICVSIWQYYTTINNKKINNTQLSFFLNSFFFSFKIKMSRNQYWNSYYKDKMISWLYYFDNGNPFTTQDHHVDKIFIIGYSGNCHNDNLRCSRYWKIFQCDDLFIQCTWKRWSSCWKRAHMIYLTHLPPSAAYMHQWFGSALVQIMACRLFGAKPLSKPMLGYCQLDP